MAKLIDAKGVGDYAVYLMDYGAPVGYRMFAEYPKWQALFRQYQPPGAGRLGRE